MKNTRILLLCNVSMGFFLLFPSILTPAASSKETRAAVNNALEQQAVGNINSLIGQIVLTDPVANLTPSINALASNLANIQATSTRYAPTVALINNFIDALAAQAVTTIVNQNAQQTNAAVLLPLLDPIFNAMKAAFASNNDVTAEINKVYTSSQQTLTWHAQLNQTAANTTQTTTYNTQNTTAMTTMQQSQQTLTNQMPDYYLLNLSTLLTSKNTNLNLNMLCTIYNNLTKKMV